LIEKHRDVLSYLFFGCVTTLVNYIVYFLLYNIAHLSGAYSNTIAWAVAVAVAFVTNKPFVFKSYDWSWKTVWPELVKFVGSRIGSGLLETGIIVVTVDQLSMDGNVMKLLTGILVIVLNYIAGKCLVFKDR
jgi:putative flippase GtrA